MPGGINYGTFNLPRAGYTQFGTFFVVSSGGFGGIVPWQATTSAAWISGLTPSSSSPPQRSDHLDFVAAPYTGLTIRIDYILINCPTQPASNGYFTVEQPGLPTYTFSPTGVTLSSAAQIAPDNLIVDNSQGAAGWNLFANVPWIIFPGGGPPPPAGSYGPPLTIPPQHSPVTGTFSVTQNLTGSPRTGTITVHDSVYNKDFLHGIIPPTTAALATFTVTQAVPDAGPDPVLPPPGDGGSGGAASYTGPTNLADDRGFYFRCAIANTGIVYSWRANNNGPWPIWDVVHTPVSDTAVRGTARMAYQTETRRIYIVYAHIRLHGTAGTDVYLGYSDNEATNWNGADLMIPGGTHPTICIGLDGTIVVAAYVGPIGGPGILQSVVMGPGDTVFTAPITLKDGSGANLVAQDDVFHIVMSPAGDRSWFMAFMHGTDTEPSEWTSADADASTWKIP